MTSVTLTSDLGRGSFELAAIKGSLLSKFEHNVNIVDISHKIAAFNIVDAAFVLGNSYPYFPPGTIHIASINPFYSKQAEILIIEQNKQFFIAPNNGLLPLLFEEIGFREAYKLDRFNDSITYFDQICSTAKMLASGKAIEEFASLTENINRRISLRPVISENSIRGTITYIDNFGNVISNISEAQFEKIRKGRSFAIYFRHKDPITEIKKHYNQVAVGEELCLFTISGNLELAVNMGNASELLGLNLDDIIQIDFFN